MTFRIQFKMIKVGFLAIILIFSNSILFSQEKFEGLIASVNSEAITTFDLSERIKLVLKSLDLEDNIKNRDSIRERVLELLILEKIKKNEALNSNINYTEDELIEFASSIYKFPKEKFDEFKSFIKKQEIDIDIVLEQISSELLWKKFSRQKFSSIITINEKDVDEIFEDYKNKVGKTQYNYSEILFENQSEDEWGRTEERLMKVLSMLEQNISFEVLANKFSDSSMSDNNGNMGWIFEDNLDAEIRAPIISMKKGDFKKIKTKNGYKIIRLNQTKTFGNVGAKYSFLKISSFEKNLIISLPKKTITCETKASQDSFSKDINFDKINDILSNEMSIDFLKEIQKVNIGEMTKLIESNGEFSILLLCEKNKTQDEKENVKIKEQIERKMFADKFQQLSNTYISNLRKNANIKFLNK